MDSTFHNQRARLAEAIARDMLAERKPPQKFPSCFACGRSYCSGEGRFCSARCRAAFDVGGPVYEPIDVDRFYSLPKGRHGFLIDCPTCRMPFDSRGLRCCSIDCERGYRDKQKLEAELADDPFRAIKRKCDACRRDIPNWRNGRRVSKATRFCSDRCATAARRKSAGLDPSDQTSVLSPETVKRYPKNGGFSRVVFGPTTLFEAAE
jgi:hypothetical protein